MLVLTGVLAILGSAVPAARSPLPSFLYLVCNYLPFCSRTLKNTNIVKLLLFFVCSSATILDGQVCKNDAESFANALSHSVHYFHPCPDFGYNNGTAKTPNIDAWAARKGSIKMQDFHSAGTVCSPTRASVLTGRTPLRDCINGVYGCSDMTECVPHFEFAPQRTCVLI